MASKEEIYNPSIRDSKTRLSTSTKTLELTPATPEIAMNAPMYSRHFARDYYITKPMNSVSQLGLRNAGGLNEMAQIAPLT